MMIWQEKGNAIYNKVIAYTSWISSCIEAARERQICREQKNRYKEAASRMMVEEKLIDVLFG
ncbi:hypothetical protein FE392_05915 [Xenorhabdus sp. 12]|uniref:Uncharacterized protein n=1 Tax=Xenorhabdus santafensis TaxID=2582833 RepID=A0ABU4S7V0_9GAMM|nr:hypothetical protein [Xenorhabdus sp. 12]MDX7986868.1 hypothetical protein [Xenorhabdus sp. 12]